MNKWHGKIGFEESYEKLTADGIGTGVYKQRIIERPYYGDLTRNIRRVNFADKLVRDVMVNNEIRVVADPYAFNHFYNMKYIEFSGVLWNADSVVLDERRLVVTLGEIYNGPTPKSTGKTC